MKTIILASSSPARRQLIEKLNISFEAYSPNVDESIKPGESANDLVKRLSLKKAQEAAKIYPKSLIIGSDQVATLNGEIFGKPLNHQNAKNILTTFSGKKITFLTGLCLLDAEFNRYQLSVEPYFTTFKPINEKQIEHYLRTEQPYHCAGGLKIDGLGITLIDDLSGRDYNGLIGLPLIKLCEMLDKLIK